MLTKEQKEELYREGRYRCPPPPVPCNLWTDESWIRFIDEWGKWDEYPVCPNCGQWQRPQNYGDCIYECKRKGFAP